MTGKKSFLSLDLMLTSKAKAYEKKIIKGWFIAIGKSLEITGPKEKENI